MNSVSLQTKQQNAIFGVDSCKCCLAKKSEGPAGNQASCRGAGKKSSCAVRTVLRPFTFVLTVAVVFGLTDAEASASECSQETKADLREVANEFSELEKQYQKIVSREDALKFRNSKLPAVLQINIPESARPEISIDEFVDGNLTVECGEDGNPKSDLSEIRSSIETTAKEVDEWERQVGEQLDELGLAEAEAQNAGSDATADATNDDQDVPSTSDDSKTTDASDVTQASSDSDDGTSTRKEPLRDPENESAFIRVISLPQELVFDSVDGDIETAEDLPVFSVLYVFDEDESSNERWLEVGPSLRDPPIGWMPASGTLDWSTMLVMQFAPPGQRERTLFFSDENVLKDMMDSAQYAQQAKAYYERIETERVSAEEDPSYVPQWDSELVAIEPQATGRFEDKPYLLPILDWSEHLFDNVTESVLLKVAAVPSQSDKSLGDRDEASFQTDAAELAEQGGSFRVGVVFVLDTTISMAPFIERTRETIQYFYDAFAEYETASFVSFGIVGFRDNIDGNQNIEYVSKIFQPLDIEADPKQILSSMEQVTESSVPTKGFKEDVYAGVYDAMKEMNWGPFNARLIVLVTDASARSGDDPAGSLSNATDNAMADLARRENIAILPVHLITPANTKNGDVERARAQYEVLASTGDPNYNKYVGIDATNDTQFAEEMRSLATEVANGAFQVNAGLILSEEENEPVPAGNSRVAQAAANEIFRAQLESLATVEDDIAPAFLEGWAADLDLTDPDNRMLTVSVFLTRDQLSTLSKRLSAIVEAFRNGGDDPKTFFSNLQILAAETVTDPNAPAPTADDAIEVILPSFLKNLPYRSQALSINQDFWSSLSVAQRQELVESLEEKLSIYQSIEDNVGEWQDFGAGVAGLEVTLVPLTRLP